MDRKQAAALLGVAADADADAVRHAWRFWARIAHPDAGGDPAHFAQLDQARRLLLRSTPVAVPKPPPRLPLRSVLRAPAHPWLLAGAWALALATALLPRVLPVPLALAALPAALAATAWAAWACRALLVPAADRGHRIVILAVLWAPLAGGQVLWSTLVGASLLPLLPLLAVPIAAAVAILEPGPGISYPNSAETDPRRPPDTRP